MANVNISNLSEKTTVSDSDVLLVEDSTATYKTTKANLLKEVNAKIKTIPTKVSQLTNDSGFLTSVPSEYITESELSSKGYLTAVPEEYVTETELNEKADKTQHTELAIEVQKKIYKPDVAGSIGKFLVWKSAEETKWDELPKLTKVDVLSPESQLSEVITAFNNLITDLKAKGYMGNS